jgi:hypothetical protein
VRHFKLPLLVTGITVLIAVIVGVIVVTSIHRSQASDQRKLERAQQVGGAVAVGACLVIAPFWLLAASKVGKERRQARQRMPRGQNQVSGRPGAGRPR